jgi:PAS domain S-box-containing protein
MHEEKPTSPQALDEYTALRTILEGTATETGKPFFAALVKKLCEAIGTHGAWVTEYVPESRRLRALAFWLEDHYVEEYEYAIAGTPCEPVIDQVTEVHIPENVISLYPQDPDLKMVGAVSYMGLPLLDIDGTILGHLAVLDTRPMPRTPRNVTVFRIFGARAAAELRRLRAEAEVHEREEKLSRLVDSAMDAIVEFDCNFMVTLFNPAAEKVFGCLPDQIIGKQLGDFLTPESRERLVMFMAELDDLPAGRQSGWIPGGLDGISLGGQPFTAEATLSRVKMQAGSLYLLILRDVNEKIEAERKIRVLTAEAEYLRDEIKALTHFNEIIGESEALMRMLEEVRQVAETDATVLIFGETGTGKELIARAIHAESLRRHKPLIKVNCAAIPATLMESEFFGHEQGAFTGATQKRHGRFAMADGGTIFLDEIGELSPELQVKLLRVLQEGEFEPVGSSTTRRVDVRVIAATNRNLELAIEKGEFREDLYYRLNVFPITSPPLRERGDDVCLLVAEFARKSGRRIGRKIGPLSPASIHRLKAYHWPGNIRELQNVIERAVITSRDGHLNLDRALPETAECASAADTAPSMAGRSDSAIRTQDEMQQLERDNLIRALISTGWRVSGKHGAAQLLAMNPSTLSSRIKALGIRNSDDS